MSSVWNLRLKQLIVQQVIPTIVVIFNVYDSAEQSIKSLSL